MTGTTDIDPRKLVAEFLGTGFLVLGVVGSGIMAERLSDDVGLQLLENSIATAGILLAVILAFGPVSGAHFNPIVTLAERTRGTVTTAEAAGFMGAQVLGGIGGVMAANVMFGLSAVSISDKDRSGVDLLFSEVVATVGLLLVIYGVVTAGKPTLAALTVAGYIGGAYWFTSSTSFANPAVTIGRMLTDTFTGIDPLHGLGFIGAQLIGAMIAIPLFHWLFAHNPTCP